jgi:hypothetical protein
MKESNYLSMVVAYYLSKFNEKAYEELGLGNRTESHKAIGNILDVNENTVKNMRDEFDPLHDNPRSGWHQRPLRPSRQQIVEQYQDLEEEELRDLVIEILEKKSILGDKDGNDSIEIIDEKNSEPLFIVRGPTGRKAEEIFVRYHSTHSLPIPGNLVDMRDYGCGYDYEILGENKAFVEVKGLDGEFGGISFTSKEWDTAKKEGDKYFLVLVKNISENPKIEIINNPYKSLSPKKYIYKTVQIRWNLAIA